MPKRPSRRGARRTAALPAEAVAQAPLVVLPPAPAGAVIRLEHLAYRYPKREPVLAGVSTTVEPGEFVSIVGESGAGKTTLLKLIYGALPVTEGRVWVDGQDLYRAPARRLAGLRRRLGFVFQDYALLPRLTAVENVRFPLEATRIWMSRREATRCAIEALESVGLADRLDSFPVQLSGGQQQRLAIARALVMRPRILLADEPTGNLDEANGQRVLDLLVTIARKGTAVLVATHDRRVFAVGDRRLELTGGRLVEVAAGAEAAAAGA